jgi:hypothetical protein
MRDNSKVSLLTWRANATTDANSLPNCQRSTDNAGIKRIEGIAANPICSPNGVAGVARFDCYCLGTSYKSSNMFRAQAKVREA